jgi:anti-anti-sigma factor
VADDEYSIVHLRGDADAARVLVTGEFDLDNAPALSAALAKALADVDHVVVDLSGMTFMDSSALRAIVLAYEAALDVGKRLTLVNPQPPVRRIFEIVELSRMLDDDNPQPSSADQAENR